MTRREAELQAIREAAAGRVIDAHWARPPAHGPRSLDPAEAEALAEVEALWAEARMLGASPAYAELLGPPTLRERWVSFWQGLGPAFAPPRLAFASALFALLLTASALFVARPWAPDYATRTAELREVPLADGSTVTLGAKSGIDVDFSPALRKVSLTAGEAYFAVSKDKSRPFLVEAGGTLIRVVGTRFSVKVDGDRVRVLVAEGVVQVMRRGQAPERLAAKGEALKVQLVAGQQLLATPEAPLPPIQPLGTAEPGAWRIGRLSYQNAPLSEVIADANRYRDTPIRITSPALAGERITTSFRSAQIDQMLDTLPASLPLRVKRRPDGSVELEPAG